MRGGEEERRGERRRVREEGERKRERGRMREGGTEDSAKSTVLPVLLYCALKGSVGDAEGPVLFSPEEWLGQRLAGSGEGRSVDTQILPG